MNNPSKDTFEVPTHLKPYYSTAQIHPGEVRYTHQANRLRAAWELAELRQGKPSTGADYERLEQSSLAMSDADIDNYMIHRLALELAAQKYNGIKQEEELKANRKQWDIDHTCPICHGIESSNNRYGPCKQCAMVARLITANTAERNKAVSQWLKTNDVDWLRV